MVLIILLFKILLENLESKINGFWSQNGTNPVTTQVKNYINNN